MANLVESQGASQAMENFMESSTQAGAASGVSYTEKMSRSSTRRSASMEIRIAWLPRQWERQRVSPGARSVRRASRQQSWRHDSQGAAQQWPTAQGLRRMLQWQWQTATSRLPTLRREVMSRARRQTRHRQSWRHVEGRMSRQWRTEALESSRLRQQGQRRT